MKSIGEVRFDLLQHVQQVLCGRRCRRRAGHGVRDPTSTSFSLKLSLTEYLQANQLLEAVAKLNRVDELAGERRLADDV